MPASKEQLRAQAIRAAKRKADKSIQRTTVYFRDVRKHVKDMWKSVCAKRGIKMCVRFEELMLRDIADDAISEYSKGDE